MLEAKVEQHLCKRIRVLGGEVRKVKWIGRKSAPDRLVLLGPGNTTILLRNKARAANEPGSEAFGWLPGLDLLRQWQHPLVELKRPGEVPRDDQLREHEKLRAAGFIVLVLDSIEAVDEAFPL